MIAALFVETSGPYKALPGVDAWDKTRDARKYTGPYPVVAHPPCERWGRYAKGGPSVRVPRVVGDDDGCFASALRSVRTFGGVLEHPEASKAWDHHYLAKPPRAGGWVPAGDRYGGYTCCVEQGHYGHPARKATWLYAVACTLQELSWGPSTGRRLDEGFHSKAERDAARAAGQLPIKRLSTRENLLTPPAFRDVLLGLARTAI